MSAPRPERQRNRVLLVDDQALLRRAIASLLRAEPDFELVGAAGDVVEAIAKVPVLRPDVLLMEIRMPHVRQSGGDPEGP